MIKVEYAGEIKIGTETYSSLQYTSNRDDKDSLDELDKVYALLAANVPSLPHTGFVGSTSFVIYIKN
jgi:hypothetical protein